MDSDRYIDLANYAQQLYNDTDFGLVGCPAFNGVWERATYLCGFERMLMGLISEKDFVHSLLDQITRITKVCLDKFLDLVGDYIQVIKMGDDLGSQNGPLISAAMYREMIMPYHQELFTLIKAKTNAKVFLHSCGSVFDLLPDLIEAGVDILNPVQVSALKMDTKELKKSSEMNYLFGGQSTLSTSFPMGQLKM